MVWGPRPDNGTRGCGVAVGATVGYEVAGRHRCLGCGRLAVVARSGGACEASASCAAGVGVTGTGAGWDGVGVIARAAVPPGAALAAAEAAGLGAAASSATAPSACDEDFVPGW